MYESITTLNVKFFLISNSKYKNLEYLIFINFLRRQILIVSIDTMSKLYFKRIRLFHKKYLFLQNLPNKSKK
ncbi:hypothetical protein BpHYR1_031848 [Brachionus plicatilis]|uniref:Uncharacterized protein n=1 Tax=Brachionus plicatilis TaxID=10195 RepID=A0A3M7PFS2_BRAPC|nr:hypothetical protein BpHYR1_031848 [Brachionus plicatilis]